LRDPDHDPEFTASPAFDPGKPRPSVVDRVLAWFDRHVRALLLAGLVLQSLVLLTMVASAARPLVASRGRTVLLRVVPVDPRDLFRGDYVILSYEISRMLVAAASPGALGQPVYVTLAPEADGRHYRGVSASLERPEPEQGGPFYLQGALSGPGHITFGIESYFVQEGQGKPYEDAARNHKLSAEVVVTPQGVAELKGLVIE
jgi:uncharacterized membrane-anchored protein